MKLRDFKGQVSNVDPIDVPAGGAAVQNNVSTTKAGLLAVRKGIQPATFTATATISSANYSTFQRMSFCKTRFGDLIGVNGIDRGFRWDGLTANVELLGIEAPAAAPVVTTASGGAATEGDYLVAYRYLDNTLPDPIPSSLSPTLTVAAEEDEKFEWTLPGTGPARATHVQIYRSTAGGANVLYRIATLPIITTTYTTDDDSDETLNLSPEEDVLRILLEDGSLEARRFVPPPNDRAYVKMFQDRYWYFGTVRYTRGTVTTNGTTTLTGSGTDWVATLADRYIAIDGEPAPIKVSAVGSGTSLTLATAATTSASGKSYVIYPSPETRRTCYYCADEKTQALTKTGWKAFDQISTEDQVLTINPTSQQIEWQHPSAINVFPHKGELVRWKGRTMDALTTLDHRWLSPTSKNVGDTWKWDLSKLKFRTTREANSVIGALMLGGGVPSCAAVATYEDEFVALVGWFVTEGHINGPNGVTVSQSIKHNPKHVATIRRIGQHFRLKDCTVSEHGRDAEELSFYFGLGIGKALQEAAPNKNLSPEFLCKLTVEQCRLLYKTLIDGDGHRSNVERFIQKRADICDGFQMLCAMLGVRTHCRQQNGKDCNLISVYQRQLHASPRKYTLESHDGIVWCPTTPNGTWMARRNGYTYWTGNSESDEPESVPTTNVVTIQENTGDDDDIVGGMPRGAYLYILMDRHKYALAFVRQPRLDASVVMIDERGAFNDQCWAYLEDIAYLMDDQGPYAFDGARSEPIGAAIQNLWKKDADGERLDFAKKAKFHVAVDRIKERIYFFVCFVGDTGDYPTRALVYNVRRKTWDVHQYPIAIASATFTQIAGQTRLIVGGETATVHVADAGNTEIVTAEIRGAVASATGTTLTDSAANFTDAVLGAWVYIYDGTGKGQGRKITARNSTQLTVATWDTTPDATSLYIVGAIPFSWKSGRFRLQEGESQTVRRIAIDFSPTEDDVTLDMRLYFNRETTPRSASADQNLGDGIKIDLSQPQDVQVLMQEDRSELAPSSGQERYEFSGRSGQHGHVDRYVALELRGYQGDDPVEIQQITIDGVEE